MKSELGYSLMETLVALALLGIIAVGFISTLGTTSKAVMVSQERVVGEGLGKSQLEYIKVRDYIPTASYDPNDPANRYDLINISDDLVAKGYDVEINPPETITSPGEGEQFELQCITVVIRRNGEQTLTISGYKVGKSS